MSVKLQERFEAFLRDFMLPLIAGGRAMTGQIIPPHALEYFSLAGHSDPTLELELHEAFAEITAPIALAEQLPFPERGAMAMAIACHNLLALTDPMLDRALVRSIHPKVTAWLAETVAQIGAPTTRGQALTRHAVLSRTLVIAREDTVVKNWAYTYRFFGRTPPANVTAMPKLRFVKQQTKHRPLALLLQDESPTLGYLLAKLIERSPITLLLSLTTNNADLVDVQFGGAVLRVLSDQELRHGIEQIIVRQGTERVAAPFGEALRRLGDQNPPGECLTPALAFLAELQILQVLDRRKGTVPKQEPGIGDEELFAAVLPAIYRTNGALRRMIDLEEGDHEVVLKRARQRRGQAGEDAVEYARELVQRADLDADASAPDRKSVPG